MKVNTNTATIDTFSKLESSKELSKKDDFKSVLQSHELQSKTSGNENVHKKSNGEDNFKKTESNDSSKLNIEKSSQHAESIAKEDISTKEPLSDEEAVNLKTNIVKSIELKIDSLVRSAEKLSEELVGTDELTEELEQIQQLLQSLNSMLKSFYETSPTENLHSEHKPVDLNQLLGGEKLTSDAMNALKSKLSAVVALLQKSKESSLGTNEILDMLQKVTTQLSDVKENLSLVKNPNSKILVENNEVKLLKDSQLNEGIKQNTNNTSDIAFKNEMQSSSDGKKSNNFSGNSSSEEKFLKTFMNQDKDEMKISKVVNFMNQFETVKSIDTSKVQTPNVIIDKNNVGADIIKSIKFMEVNNMKDLTVKMNPKELGEITIKIVVESGVMKANISAQNKETYQLLNQNIQDISDKLKNMDIKIQALEINIYEDSTFFSKDSNKRNNEGSQNNEIKGNNLLEEEEDLSIINNYSIDKNVVNKFV